MPIVAKVLSESLAGAMRLIKETASATAAGRAGQAELKTVVSTWRWASALGGA
jgi:hypothetical protein